MQRETLDAQQDLQWHDDYQRCAQQGLLGLYMPEEYGGQGHDVITAVLMLEALGQGCADNGLLLAVNALTWTVQEPILAFATPQQKARFLPPLCDGSMIGAHAITEEKAGSDAFAMTTTATRKDGGYLLNGEKSLIGMATLCDMVLLFATLDPGLKQWGVTAFLVETDREGVSLGPSQEKMGLRTMPFGKLSFNNVWIPEENRLGPEGAGASIFQHTMEWERSFILTSYVGSMQRQLDTCIRFSKEREVFGQSIDGHQSVSNRLAEMKLRLETSRLLLYQAAWLKQQNQPAAMQAAMAKLHISEAFVASSTDAIRIHGGKGYLTAEQIERDLRDAMGSVIYSGTSDIQRQIIVRLLEPQFEPQATEPN